MNTKNPSSTTTDAQAPVDPDAPTTLTLPSGKVVQIRSHRTLVGADGIYALNAHSGTGNGNAEIRAALVARMATEVEPGTGGKPPLDGTLEAVHAQRLDDARQLLFAGPVTEGWRLVAGLSVVPDAEQWKDPTGPTRDSSGSKPPSAESAPS